MDTPAVPTSHVKRRKRRWPWILLGLLAIFLVFAIDLAWAGAACGRQLPAGARRADGGRRLAPERRGGGRPERVRLGGGRRSSRPATRSGTPPSRSSVGCRCSATMSMRPVAAPRRSCWPPRAAPRTPTPPTRRAGTGSRCPGSRPEVTSTPPRSSEPRPAITKAADLLAQADAELAPVDADSLQPPLDRLMREAKDEIHTRSEQATTAANLAKLLPPMLGADGARTYLLVTLSPSDPRGSGGYPGRVRVAARRWTRAVASRTSRRRREIPTVPPVPGPADAKKAWGWAGIDRIFWDTTYTPDFPTAAGFMKGIWEAGGGQARRRRDRGRSGADGVAPAGRRSGRLSGVARDDHRRQRRADRRRRRLQDDVSGAIGRVGGRHRRIAVGRGAHAPVAGAADGDRDVRRRGRRAPAGVEHATGRAGCAGSARGDRGVRGTDRCGARA